MKKLLLAASLLFASQSSFAVHGITLYDLNTTYYMQITAPPTLAGVYRVMMPSTTAVSSGSVLGVQSISGSTLTLNWQTISASGGVWGSITGTLSAQTDLQSALTAIGVSTASLNSSIVTLGISTGSLQTQITAVAASTGVINTSLGVLQTQVTAIAASTGTINATVGTLQTQVTAIAVSTGAINTTVAANSASIISLGASTGTIQTQLTAVTVSTGLINASVVANATAVASSTNTLQTNITTVQTNLNTVATAVASSTNTLQTNINTLTTTVTTNATAVAASTNTLQTNITTVQTNLNTEATNVAASTNTLQTNINTLTTTVTSNATAVAASTNTLQTNINTETTARTSLATNVAASTNTLQTNINAVGVATGTIVSSLESSTNTWTGGNIFNSFTNHVGSTTMTGGVAISSTIVLGNPASVFASTGTITSTMSVIQVSAPNTGAFITLTLPSASSNPGLDITIYKVDTTTTEVKIVGAGTDLIEGTGTIRLDAQFQHASLHSLGATGWGSGYGGIQTTPAWLGPAVDGTAGVIGASSGTIVTPFTNSVPVTVTGFRYYVTAGSGGKGVFGIYNQVGALVMSTGPVTIGTFGAATVASAPTQLPPGQYYFAFQPSNATIAIGGTSANGGNGALFCSLNTAASMGLTNPYVFPGTSTVSCYSVYVLVNGGRLTL